MKKYLIFDLDGTLIQSNNQINTIIYNYIEKNLGSEYIDHAKYIIQNNQGMSLKELFSLLLNGDNTQAEIHANNIYNEINKIEKNIVFFQGVQEKIQELNKKYTLFLSTGNSDNFANQVLKNGGIHHCFDKILGSSYILKSPDHIDELIHYTGDENFSKQSVFIGDGQRDREIAKSKNIDFIHIGSDGNDKYEIKSVDEINKILKKLDN